MAKTNKIFSCPVNNSYTPPSSINITRAIDISYKFSNQSAIDKFILKNRDLNKVLIDSNKIKSRLDELFSVKKFNKKTYFTLIDHINDPNNVSPVLANLVVLGHISSVEGYFRELYRKIINIDNVAQQSCRERMVSYGAATTHKKEALPDALLEFTTFLGADNIIDSLKNFIGIKGHLPSSIQIALQEYTKVCHIRHCIVHRFGMMGVNNAMKINWDIHKYHVDKPIKIDYNGLQEVSQICYNIVKEINNYIWNILMTRQIADIEGTAIRKKGSVEWNWIWKKDKHKFNTYFKIFFSELDPPAIKESKKMYEEYYKNFQTMI